jgi:hypothetical protein
LFTCITICHGRVWIQFSLSLSPQDKGVLLITDKCTGAGRHVVCTTMKQTNVRYTRLGNVPWGQGTSRKCNDSVNQAVNCGWISRVHRWQHATVNLDLWPLIQVVEPLKDFVDVTRIRISRNCVQVSERSTYFHIRKWGLCVRLFWSQFSVPPTEPVLWGLHSSDEAPILTSGVFSPMNYPISGVRGRVVR